MTVSSMHQMNVFLLCILTGVFMGAFFDFLRSMRRIYGSKNAVVTIEDAVFSGICIVVLVAASFYFNDGEIRYYQILGTCCGALIYASLLSRITMKLFCFIHKIFIRLFLKPLFLIIKKTARYLKKIFYFNFLKKITKKIRKILKLFLSRAKRLKKRIKML